MQTEVFYYSKKSDNRGRERVTTYCGVIGENRTLKVGYAKQRPTDKFDKKLGRTIAKGRAIKKGEIIQFPEKQLTETFISYCKQLEGETVAQ